MIRIEGLSDREDQLVYHSLFKQNILKAEEIIKKSSQKLKLTRFFQTYNFNRSEVKT